jgi:uncharacterized membrane protein YhiD involved in acid resistance
MEIFTSVSSLDNQSIYLIGFSVLLSFLLSSLIVFTYEKVSRDVITPDHFLQALILMSIVTTTIMQSIGDSPARGFGIFGALAILRFRTQMISPRNISFIFAAMAVGIACGVYSFVNAIIGTFAFCLIAFFLRLTPFSRRNNLRGQLRLELPGAAEKRTSAQQIIAQFSQKFVLKRYRILSDKGEGEGIEYTYELRLNAEMDGFELTQKLNAIEGVKNIRLNFDDTYINLYD